MTTTYLVWFDPDPKVPPGRKLEAALARHAELRGRPATRCLASPAEAAALAAAGSPVPVQAASFVRPGLFYVACDEAAGSGSKGRSAPTAVATGGQLALAGAGW